MGLKETLSIYDSVSRSEIRSDPVIASLCERRCDHLQVAITCRIQSHPHLFKTASPVSHVRSQSIAECDQVTYLHVQELMESCEVRLGARDEGPVSRRHRAAAGISVWERERNRFSAPAARNGIPDGVRQSGGTGQMLDWCESAGMRKDRSEGPSLLSPSSSPSLLSLVNDDGGYLLAADPL